MQYQGFEFYSHNKKLFGQYWFPQDPIGVIVLVHGMGEHSGRYSHFVVPELVAEGYAVIGFDHFGHGHTEGKRGVNPGYEAVLDSVTSVIEKSREIFQQLPVFLYGHSMGGHVVLSYALRRASSVKGVIATSPFLKMAFEPPAWKMFAGKLLSRIAPDTIMSSGLEPTHISRDIMEVHRYTEDPLVHDKVSPNYVFPFVKWGEWMIAHGASLKIPVFLAHGTDDMITSHWASKAFAKQSNLVTLKLIEGGYHELHNDLDKEVLMSEMINWLKENNKPNHI